MSFSNSTDYPPSNTMRSIFSTPNKMPDTKVAEKKKEWYQKGEALDRKIVQLRNELRNAQLERVRLHRGTVAPNCNAAWSQLPAEILASIFQQSVDADAHGHTLSPRAMPWVLAEICGQWREIAVSILTLWNTIRVHVDYMYHQPYQVVGTWLERYLPLSISFFVMFENSDFYHPDKSVIFDSFLGSCGRS